MEELLEKERQERKKLEAQAKDVKSSQNIIDTLMEQITAIEKEKSDLASKFDKVSKKTEDEGVYKKRISEMSQVLEESEKALHKERSDKASLEHSQDELLKKMKELQKENDQLVTKLEGLKTDNEGLLSKNKKLEDRIKVLETQNKQQLQQINDTLSLPAPPTPRPESSQGSAKVSFSTKKENDKDSEIAAVLLSPIDTFETVKSFASSVSPILKDKLRSLSTDKKDAKKTKPDVVTTVVTKPTIVSSISSTMSSTIERLEVNNATSNDALTLPNDSMFPSNSATFAETFSRSGNPVFFHGKAPTDSFN